MLRYLCRTLVVSTVLLTIHSSLLTPYAHAAACTNSYASGASAPTGYAVAWNPLTAARELLVQGTDCTTTSATMKVGSGAATQFVYNKGYLYTGSAWQEYTLTSTAALQGNAWYTGSAQASVNLPQTVTYVVGYVCQQQGSTWKCGCRDSTCATSYWQLQAVKGAAAEPPSTGGGTATGGGSTGGAIAKGDPRIAGWGDSLTAPRQWPEILGPLFSPARATYNGGVGGQTATQIANRQVADTQHKEWITVIWAGRNGFMSGDTVKKEIARMVAHIKPNERYIVMSILNANTSDEQRGTTRYNACIKLNNELAALYPDHFIDIRTIIVGSYDPSKSGDVATHARDVPPASLLKDHIHLNTAGQTIVAKEVYKFITAKGW